MTVVYPTSDIIVFGYAISDSGGTLSIAHTNTLIIDADINIVSTNSNALDFTLQNLNVQVNGDISAGTTALNLDYYNTGQDSAFDYQVSIGKTGTVNSHSHAIYVGSNSHNFARLGNANVTNAGEVTSFDGVGVFLFFALDAVFSNSGSVKSLDNDGSFSSAVHLFGVTNAVFENSGTIENWLGYTVKSIDTAAVRFSDGTENVSGVNSGVISSGALAVYSDATTTETFTNTGVINGDVWMSNVVGGDFANSGVVNGDVALRGGYDTFDGRGGTVSGDVLGGGGNDTYIIDDTKISLVENFDEGVDLVQSFVGWELGDNFENLDLLGAGDINGNGNELANIINGNIGDNTLRGRSGGDTLDGKSGDDVLRGGRGNDSLNGDEDQDTLFGGRGNDTLSGGHGDDTLVGGLGKDTLTGNHGDDIFKFNKVAHSTNDTSADTITDFASGEDLIDLAALSGTLTFIGTDLFSGTQSELRVTESGGNSIVRIDVDGDGSADMKIKVSGVIELDAPDFIL